jgi:hypothetical protein
VGSSDNVDPAGVISVYLQETSYDLTAIIHMASLDAASAALRRRHEFWFSVCGVGGWPLARWPRDGIASILKGDADAEKHASSRNAFDKRWRDVASLFCHLGRRYGDVLMAVLTGLSVDDIATVIDGYTTDDVAVEEVMGCLQFLFHPDRWNMDERKQMPPVHDDGDDGDDGDESSEEHLDPLQEIYDDQVENYPEHVIQRDLTPDWLRTSVSSIKLTEAFDLVTLELERTTDSFSPDLEYIRDAWNCSRTLLGTYLSYGTSDSHELLPAPSRIARATMRHASRLFAACGRSKRFKTTDAARADLLMLTGTWQALGGPVEPWNNVSYEDLVRLIILNPPYDYVDVNDRSSMHEDFVRKDKWAKWFAGRPVSPLLEGEVRKDEHLITTAVAYPGEYEVHARLQWDDPITSVGYYNFMMPKPVFGPGSWPGPRYIEVRHATRPLHFTQPPATASNRGPTPPDIDAHNRAWLAYRPIERTGVLHTVIEMFFDGIEDEFDITQFYMTTTDALATMLLSKGGMAEDLPEESITRQMVSTVPISGSMIDQELYSAHPHARAMRIAGYMPVGRNPVLPAMAGAVGTTLGNIPIAYANGSTPLPLDPTEPLVEKESHPYPERRFPF